MQKFEAVKQTKAYAEIVDQISAMIERGDLKPEERLPSERTLSASLAIGRQSLREALSVLEAIGLIEVRHGIGTFVRADALSRLPVLDRDRVEIDNPFEFLEARRVIEPEVAALAAKRATEAEIADMETALKTLEETPYTDKREYELDRLFHLSIARGAHNNFLYRSMAAITEQMSTQLWIIMKEKSRESLGVPDLLHQDHVAILAAVRSRDSKKAAQAMQGHLRGIERSFLQK